MKRKQSLEDFLPPRKASSKSQYTMVRFDKQPSLLEYMLKRTGALRIDKQSYILALIAKDKAEQDETE